MVVIVVLVVDTVLLFDVLLFETAVTSAVLVATILLLTPALLLEGVGDVAAALFTETLLTVALVLLELTVVDDWASARLLGPNRIMQSAKKIQEAIVSALFSCQIQLMMCCC